MPYLAQFRENINELVGSQDEIILVDDQSTDLTRNFIIDWSESDSRIVVLDNMNRGLVQALNLGLASAKNDWIARFDVDDCYHYQRLEKQRKLLLDNVSAVFCDYQFFSNHSANLGVSHSAIFPDAMVMSLCTGQRTPHPGVIFNKTKAFSVGSYSVHDFPAEDLSLWLRMARVGTLLSVPEVLLNYRISSTSVTANHKKISLAQRKRLLRRNSILNEMVDKSVDKLGETIQKYKLVENSYSRIALHMRDIFLVSVQNRKFHKLSMLFFNRAVLFSLPRILIAALLIVINRMHRKFHRIISKYLRPFPNQAG